MRLDVETIAGRRETMQEGVTQTMSLVSAAVCQPSAVHLHAYRAGAVFSQVAENIFCVELIL